MRQNQSPDWRWCRARYLADHHLSPSRVRDDAYVIKACRFLRKLKSVDPVIHEELYNDLPELYEAYNIYVDTRSGLRWLFEASVMANKPVDYMAEYLQTDAPVLKEYEAVFFDVRNALLHRGCIVANLLMPLFTNSVAARDPDVMWKAMAYYGDWDAVTANWEMGHASPAALAFITKANDQKIAMNAFDALHTAKINNFNATEHIRIAMEKSHNDFEAGLLKPGEGGAAALNGLLSSIQMTVQRTNISLSPEEPRLMHPDDAQVLDDQADSFVALPPLKSEEADIKELLPLPARRRAGKGSRVPPEKGSSNG